MCEASLVLSSSPPHQFQIPLSLRGSLHESPNPVLSWLGPAVIAYSALSLQGALPLLQRGAWTREAGSKGGRKGFFSLPFPKGKMNVIVICHFKILFWCFHFFSFINVLQQTKVTTSYNFLCEHLFKYFLKGKIGTIVWSQVTILMFSFYRADRHYMIKVFLKATVIHVCRHSYILNMSARK